MLYIAIALDSITKDGVSEQGNTNYGVTQNSRPSNISISELLKNINPKDESFYKYIPKMFFESKNDTQKRYALSVVDSDNVDLIDNYTEKQYNDFGWARVNGVLSHRENGDFKAKYRKIKSGTQKEIHRTANGEIIVAVNDMENGKFGVNNVLVFAKGSYENYKITKVVRLKSNNETHLEVIRGFIYEYEKDTNTKTRYVLEDLYGEEVIGQYNSGDFDDYRTLKKKVWRRKRGDESGGIDGDNQSMSNGRGDTRENKDNEIDRGQYALNTKGSDKVMTELPNDKESVII